MRSASFLSLLLATVLVAGCANGSRQLVTLNAHPQLYARGERVIDSVIDRNLLSDLVINYINLYRSKRSVALLTYESKASQAAFWMSDYQAKVGQVSHVAKPAGMTRMGDRYRSLGGGPYAAAFENTGWYPIFNSPGGRNYTYDEMARNIVDGWINSPKHHEGLIVNAQGEGFIGLGVAKGRYHGVSGIYATMNIFFYLPEWSPDNAAVAGAQPRSSVSGSGSKSSATAKSTAKQGTTAKKTTSKKKTSKKK